MRRLAAFFLLLVSTAAYAETGVGTVTQVQGKAYAVRDGSERELKAEDSFQSGDILKTGADGTLDVAINNIAGVRVLPGTEAEATSLSPENMRLRMMLGNVVVNLDKLPSSESKFQVETPTAIASVRGTQFWGNVDAAVPGDPNTTFAVREGSIRVESFGTGEVITLNEGFALDIPKDFTGGMHVRQAAGYEMAAMDQASTIKTCG